LGSPPFSFTAADWNALTDARIAVVKAALQLKPDQAKYWPGATRELESDRRGNRGYVSRHLANVGCKPP
jgi:hypothetical protein